MEFNVTEFNLFHDSFQHSGPPQLPPLFHNSHSFLLLTLSASQSIHGTVLEERRTSFYGTSRLASTSFFFGSGEIYIHTYHRRAKRPKCYIVFRRGSFVNALESASVDLYNIKATGIGKEEGFVHLARRR